MLTPLRVLALVMLLLGASLVAACGGARTTPTIVAPEASMSSPAASDLTTPTIFAPIVPTPIPTPSAPGTLTVPPPPTIAPPTPSATPLGQWERRLDEQPTLYWRLVELDAAAVPSGLVTVLNLGAVRQFQRHLFGMSGCWEYSAMVEQMEQAISLVPLPTGELVRLFVRGCQDNEKRPALVDDYVAALSAADAYRTTDGRLQIVDGDGTTRLVYEPTRLTDRPAALTGTTWMLRSLRGREPLPGLGVTLQVNPDGVSGTNGCNYYSGDADVGGDGELHVSESGFMQTAMGCADAIMTQSQEYDAALLKADSYRLDRHQLEIHDEDNETLLVFSEPGIDDLAGVTWKVGGIERQVGGAPMLEGIEVTLTIDDTGRLTGSAGCNDYTGDVTIDGSTIAVRNVVQTLKECIDPPGIMEQERAFLEVLGDVTTWELSATMLRLDTADDRALVLWFRQR